MNTMSRTPTSTKDAATRANASSRLRALRLDNYRSARWNAIDTARKSGLTWEEVGEALGVMSTAAARIYRVDAPAPAGD